MAVSGKCDPKFAKVKEEFERNFAERGEVGASVCLSVNGETAVDLWGGMANPETNDPWQEDTISIVFSCTKAAVALCAHILIDRGQLNPAALVSEYWPEFAQKGKEKTTVQMMLNHESALPTLRDPVKPGGYTDWTYMTGRMADEEAFWEVGTRNGYHMINFGWTVGELVRRVSGKSLGTFFREEVAEKTGAKFWIGLPESEKVHIAPIRQYAPKPGDQPSEFAVKLMTEPEHCRSNYWLQTLKLNPECADQRDAVLQAANDAGFMTRPSWILMHELSPFKDCPRMDLECARSLSQRLINIPSSSGLI